MTDIAPAETWYRGYHFRSRLEARWAVAFDLLKIPFQYEPEKFDLPNGTRYIPDFFLPEQDCFVEIKGKRPNEEELYKARCVADIATVYVCYGDISDYHVEPILRHYILTDPVISAICRKLPPSLPSPPFTLAQCAFCGRFAFETRGSFVNHCQPPHGPYYCPEWLAFCQKFDVDASTICNADPKGNPPFFWPSHSPMRDMAFNAAKSIRFEDPNWSRGIRAWQAALETLGMQKVYTTPEEMARVFTIIEDYRESDWYASFSDTWLYPGHPPNAALIKRFELTKLMEREDYQHAEV